jgi:hypothetical protein
MELKPRGFFDFLAEWLVNCILLLFIGGVLLPAMLRLSHRNNILTPQDVVALRRSIVGQESGGNFRAVNPDSGALGYGQVMPENVSAWSREALGYELTREEFLASPDLQLAVVNYKLAQYWQEAIAATGGDKEKAVRMVASRWYSGRADWYDSKSPQFYNGTEYPSIDQYTRSVLNRYWQEKN